MGRQVKAEIRKKEKLKALQNKAFSLMVYMD